MEAFQFHQVATRIGQARSRMERHLPLDQRRHQALARQMAVGRHADAPAVVAARHGQDFAEVFAAGSGVARDVVAARHPVDQARPVGRRLAVEPEPARPARWRCRRVDGDQFEVEVLTEAKQAVVGAHAGVLAAGRERDAEVLLQPRGSRI